MEVPSKARTFWVTKEGDASWAEVTVDSTMSVARMTELIVRKLGLTERLSTLTVYVAKGKEGNAVGPPLDSRATVAAAGLENGTSIVIKAAGAAAAPGAAATLGQQDNVLRARKDADSPDFATHALQRTRGALLLRCPTPLMPFPLPPRCAAGLEEYRAMHAMSKLARGVLEASEGKDTITLPDGVRWPDMASPVLYVRHFYKDLYECVLKKCTSLPSNLGAVLMGTPGSECEPCTVSGTCAFAAFRRSSRWTFAQCPQACGQNQDAIWYAYGNVTHLPCSRPLLAVAKSAFGLYVLYRAAKEGRTVIYSARKGGIAVFKGGKAYKTRVEDLVLLDDMGDPTALYISDSLPPVASSGAFRLLITSPKKENWSVFVQSPDQQQLVLPLFTKEELLELRAVAFADKKGCSVPEVLLRFDKWGGSARSDLTFADDPSYEDRLTSAVGALSIGILESSLTGSTALDGVGGSDFVHRLFNLVPYGALPGSTLSTSNPAYYRFHHAELISSHVEGLFAASLLQKDKTELYRFLHTASSDPAVATLRGILYERCIVIPRLVHGSCGEARLVRLSPALGVEQPTWLQVPILSFEHGLPLFHFSTADELRALWAADSKDAIFVPPSKVFPVVDFVLRIGGQALLANATVGESHGVKAGNAKFAEVLPAVGLDGEMQEIPLVWVLDKPAFERFDKPGQFKSEAAGDLASGVTARHAVGRRVAQYKLLLEVPPVL